MIAAACLVLAVLQPAIVVQGGVVYDGTGAPGRVADVRVEGGRVRAVGTDLARPGDEVIDARGMAVAPGFIDSHSHADEGVFEDPDAETQIRQGVTTAVVGEDGGSAYPVRDFFRRLELEPVALNFASFVGHGTVRGLVVGPDDRPSTANERLRMAEMVAAEMRDGALGLSSGLEYQPGRYADTKELVELAQAAGRSGGMYISHVRNEDVAAFKAFEELVEVARRAHVPAQINHIKLGAASVWGRAKDVLKLMDKAEQEGLDITADVYPYLYWQSTVRVIIATEQFDDRKQWEAGLQMIGGPEHVLLTRYSPDPSWEGKTIAALSRQTGKDAVTLIQQIIHECYDKGKDGRESVVVTAMSEDDLQTFLRDPRVSICSDGGLHGSHPRGAGTFPRVLGVYVREKGVLTLPEAVRKMTSMPAKRFGLRDRGRLATGYWADIVVFDPKTILDKATTTSPQAKPVGIDTVLVNGVKVLSRGALTHARPGLPLRRPR
ncbi:MAG: D-aminoacylase [Fimbriimonadaceae bacterium]|nr:D-aminoacylase [Fimbriimonadaceae bacterium]